MPQGVPGENLLTRRASVMTEQSTGYITHGGIEDQEPWTIDEPEPAEEDDEEAALEELIEAMVEPEEAAREATEALPWTLLPRRMTGEEFTCSSCHLIMARSCLADEERRLCHECVLEAAAGLPPAHHRAVERPCPVCGRVQLVPERPDSVCGYYCPACCVHIRSQRGHQHLEWNHHDHPEASVRDIAPSNPAPSHR